MKHGLIVIAAAALALGCGSARAAEPDPLRPPLAYGYTDREPRELTASVKPDQTMLTSVRGEEVVSSVNGEKLGEIEEIWLDLGRGEVQLVKLDTRGALLPWSSLSFAGAPTPHYTVALDQTDIQNAPASNPTQTQIRFDDLEGKDAMSADGTKLGAVNDAVAEFGSGRIVALVVREEIPLHPDRTRAVDWSAVKGRADDGKLRLSITPEQLAQSPRLDTKAPEAAGGRFEAPVPPVGETGAHKTLESGSGSTAPAPATRR